MTPDDRNDDRLLAELGDAVRADRAVPERFRELGRSAFAWRGVDMELATLAYDSALAGTPAGVRAGEAGARLLSFSAGGVAVEVELSTRALVGQVVPAGAGAVELWADGADPRSVPLGDDGWFDLGTPPAGPFRLCVRRGAAAVFTDRVHP